MKKQFPKVPILGLTATATKNVIDDVKKLLGLERGCLVLRSTFNRGNLFYEVVPEDFFLFFVCSVKEGPKAYSKAPNNGRQRKVK